MSISLTLTNLTTNTSRSITSIIDGDTYSWRIDDSLDSGVLMYIDNDLTPVEPFTLATITFDNGSSEKMWVAEDSVQMVSKIGNNKNYQHTLKLIELTKILEKIVVTGLCMTPTDKEATLADYNGAMYRNFGEQISAAIDRINAQVGTLYLERVTHYAPYNDVDRAIFNAPVETFIFNNATAREILDEIYSAVDCRVVVSDADRWNSFVRLKIDYVTMTPTTEIILGEDTHHKLISESASNSVESYAGEVVSHVESALNGNEIRLQDTFKANDAIATSNNRVMSLPYAIQYPTKFYLKSVGEYKMRINYEVTTETGTTVWNKEIDLSNKWFDALDYFVDYEYWLTLGSNDQNKTLYYKRGEVEVDVSRTYKALIVTRSVISNLFVQLTNKEFNDNYDYYKQLIYDTEYIYGTVDNLTINQYTVPQSLDDLVYDIAYVGEIEGLATSVKQADRTGFERDLMVVDGQTANVIDIQRYGQNLKGKIDRLGNNIVYIDCNVDSYSNILPLMTKLTDYDNGVIYQVDISRHTDSETWYEVRYYIAKDFNNLNERIALRKEKRIYAIPTKGYQVILPDRETVVIDNYSADHNSISLGATSADQRATTCFTIAQAAIGGTGTITNAFIRTDTNGYPSGAVYEYFVLPVTGYGSGNTINLVCKFYDNASAGLSIDTSSYGGINWFGGKKVCYNKYTNNYGFAKNINVDWGYFPNERTTEGVKAQPKLLTSGTGAETTGKYLNSFYGIKKDPSEALCFQKIIRIETAKPSIIIGQFVDLNSLIQSFANKQLYIYYQSTDRDPYKTGDRTVRYDSSVDTKVGILPIYANTTEYYIGLFKPSLDEVNKYNIAIGDDEGNMFIASNGLCTSGTLFTFYKKESIG